MLKEELFRADLHAHSFFSDGSKSPEQLIDMAIAQGLSGLSITDHDTINAYASALPYAKKQHLLLLPGIEFSAAYKGVSVHMLAYAFSPLNRDVLALCAKHKLRREERNKRILQKLRALGIVVETHELQDVSHSIGRPHIASLLIKKGVVSSISEAFYRFLGEGKSAYDPGEVISVEETLACIHAAQGKAIIAHPHLIIGKIVAEELLELPFDGLEGYYPRMPLDQQRLWIEKARQRGWLITGGSDFHGEMKPQNILGCAHVGKETFSLLYNHFLSHSEDI